MELQSSVFDMVKLIQANPIQLIKIEHYDGSAMKFQTWNFIHNLCVYSKQQINQTLWQIKQIMNTQDKSVQVELYGGHQSTHSQYPFTNNIFPIAKIQFHYLSPASSSLCQERVSLPKTEVNEMKSQILFDRQQSLIEKLNQMEFEEGLNDGQNGKQKDEENQNGQGEKESEQISDSLEIEEGVGSLRHKFCTSSNSRGSIRYSHTFSQSVPHLEIKHIHSSYIQAKRLSLPPNIKLEEECIKKTEESIIQDENQSQQQKVEKVEHKMSLEERKAIQSMPLPILHNNNNVQKNEAVNIFREQSNQSDGNRSGNKIGLQNGNSHSDPPIQISSDSTFIQKQQPLHSTQSESIDLLRKTVIHNFIPSKKKKIRVKAEDLKGLEWLNSKQ